jgi:peptidyl-prolyl cis-trans isomerase D
MIRILQKDTKATKILFGVIIGAAIVSMVVYLVPGLMDNSASSDSAVFATVREPGLWGRFFGESDTIKIDDATQLAQSMLQQRHYPAALIPYVMPQAIQQAEQSLVQWTIEKQAADRLHLEVSDADLLQELKTGQFAPYLFPDGKFIGEDRYMDFVQANFPSWSVAKFESQLKEDMERQRLQILITGGASVSDSLVREAYSKQGTKIKFDYAVISAAELKKTINPSDSDLQSFFKSNAAKYATAVPETRKIQYVSFDASKLPGGKATPTDAEVQAYYAAHQDQYKTVEQVKTRHILITSKAGADAATDAAAKAKAQDVLKQLQSGGNFAALAKKFSEDPGSKDAGGELPLMPTSQLDKAYAQAAMALNPGQTSGLVKSAFGYHIIQTEQKQLAGVKPLAEVKDSILVALQQQKQGAAVQQYAAQLAAEAKTNGLDKTAAAHGLHSVTTDYLAQSAPIAGLANGAELLKQAFATNKGAAPAQVSIGDGYAIFTVLDVRSAHAPEFASYKTQILEDFRDQKIPQMLATETNQLAGRAKELNDLKKAAAELKVPLKSSDLVGQDGQVPDIGAMSGPSSVAFSLPKGAISGPLSNEQTGWVLTVTDRQAPSDDEIAKNLDATREQLLAKQKEEIFRVYLDKLTKKYTDGGGVRQTKAAKASPLSK